MLYSRSRARFPFSPLTSYTIFLINISNEKLHHPSQVHSWDVKFIICQTRTAHNGTYSRLRLKVVLQSHEKFTQHHVGMCHITWMSDWVSECLCVCVGGGRTLMHLCFASVNFHSTGNECVTGKFEYASLSQSLSRVGSYKCFHLNVST